jgi:Cysteine rich repeat
MKTWLIPLSCIWLFAVTAYAQETPPAPPAPSVRQACQADVQKFCADVKPGGGRIRDCIAEHRDDLSQACRTALGAARAHRPAPKANAASNEGSQPQ